MLLEDDVAILKVADWTVSSILGQYRQQKYTVMKLSELESQWRKRRRTVNTL